MRGLALGLDTGRLCHLCSAHRLLRRARLMCATCFLDLAIMAALPDLAFSRVGCVKFADLADVESLEGLPLTRIPVYIQTAS